MVFRMLMLWLGRVRLSGRLAPRFAGIRIAGCGLRMDCGLRSWRLGLVSLLGLGCGRL
jgi:hypothetical protein